MAIDKIWSDEFRNYMEYIVNNSIYKGIPYKRKDNGEISWIATKKSNIGQARMRWAQEKAKKLGFSIQPGVYAKVMFEIHPTKSKPCQICGKKMLLYYVYLNSSLVKSLYKEFDVELLEINSIMEAVQVIKNDGVSEVEIKSFLIKKFKINNTVYDSMEQIIKNCEYICRNGNCKLLGPGAMSNFPDRLDGFHTYNRCCRSKEDLGRNKENMKNYNKDRRAYEYWSDGNIHAANKFMNSEFFSGASADHIGPISLGFKHDPLLLQKMSKGDNSSKRDRLILEDIEKIIKIEKQNPGFSAMSWFSEEIWLYIKRNYFINENKIELYRDILKQNMANFMYILWYIKSKCGENGIKFLIKYLLKPKFDYFLYSYTFNEHGMVCEASDRYVTDATRKEIDRFIRVAFEAVDNYHDKENRNIKSILDLNDIKILDDTCNNINQGKDRNAILLLVNLVKQIQIKLIQD